MKKNDEHKQSKISRHEIAKEKFRFFQRSMSCNSLNNKTDFIPAPGQFAILSNLSKKKQAPNNELPSLYGSQHKPQKTQKSIKFTTNLKLITRQRSPSRVSQLLSQTVNRKIDEHKSIKKITKSESTGNLRPLTALSTQLVCDLQGKHNLKDSKIISNAAEYDKKYYLRKQYNQGNTFMVKSRTNIPKHAYGYKSIRLTPQQSQNRLKLQSEPKNQNNRKFIKIERDNDEGQKDSFFATDAQPNFLPIEYYMIDDQKPQDLIEKYKLKENFMVGYSKWQNLQGNFQWKKCRVIDYIKDKERWDIEWLHNGKRKIVARNNLFFEKENFEDFEKIINEAQNIRKHSQVYMKYNWLIDNMKSITHTLEQNQLNKILKLGTANITITFKSQKPIENLVQQIKEKYVRANHIVQFNSSLPFNVKHKQQFVGYLPDSYFVPNFSMGKFDVKKKRPLKSEQKIMQHYEILSQKTIETKVNPSQELRKLFQTSSRKFMKITALSSISRINIIEYLNKSEVQIRSQKIAYPFDLNFQLEHKESVPQTALRFYSFSPNKMYDMSDVIVRMDNSLFESIAKLNNIVCEVEYFVAKELDPIYLQKKSVGTEVFDDMITGYRKFLGSVNMRIETMGRQLLLGMLKQLGLLLRVNENIISTTESQELYQLLDQQKKSYNSLNLKIKLQIKGQTIQATPKKQVVTETITSYINKLIDDFSQVSCIRKSYIQQLRPKNKMKIIQSLEVSQQGNGVEWKVHKELVKIKKTVLKAVDVCDKAYERFLQQIKKVYEKILNIQSDIKRKASKKSNFSDIQQYESTIKQLGQNITRLKMLSINSNMKFKPHSAKPQSQSQSHKEQQQPLTPQQQMAQKLKVQAPLEIQSKFIKVGMYSFNIEDCITKCEAKLYEISSELYKLVLQKIVKENQRMDKQIDMIISRLEKQPLNIKQMINVQQYINEEAAEELIKISGKISELHEKFSLLEKLNIQIQYKDYYECHKIYMKPIKIRAAMNGKLKEIQCQYRKKFGQDLVKEIGELAQEIRQIQEKFYQSVFIKSIDQMDSSFILFSKLKERIQTAITKSTQINQYQTAMKWINTNFTRIHEIKTEFIPYYQLISLEKNYRFHIESQLIESLHTIDAGRITQDVLNGCDQLANLQLNVFYNNPTILQIVKQVARSYTLFRDKLPLIQILRNTDLRQRHWNSIKQLTGFTDILTDKITFQQLQLRQIKKLQKKLVEISHIATRELIYQKKLNKMKKQWKQLKIHIKKLIHLPNPTQEENPQTLNQLKIISNLDDIQTKTQNDIYQIQQILSSSFIKFLQKDILNWRNFTLYKMYEFVEIWKTIEKEIVQMYKMFSKQVIKNQASAQYQKFKVLQKNWKNITSQIEQQPNILELLQTKINESLKYTVELIQDLKKSVSHFFQKKKQRFSRFGALSQQELIALYSNSNDQKQVFDQAVRKCLQGVKEVIREQGKGKMITCIKTHLDEEIQINHGIENSVNVDSLTPDRVIEDIEKRIKRSLRTSIDSIDELRERTGKILQIILFHQRIIFTREIENQLIKSNQNPPIVSSQNATPVQRGINQGYLDALLLFKQKIIQALLFQYQKIYCPQQSTKKHQNLIKIQTQLNQLINHIEIAQNLYRKNAMNIFDFEWVSQIRTYQKSNNYSVEVGLNSLEYGFQITDQQQYVVEANTAKIFCQLAMAVRERMFGLVTGNIGMGKLALLHYLSNVHGKNQLILNCHKALSQQNAFDFLRMCANGIWIVFNNINLLSRQVFSCFRQSVQLFWANYPTQKSKAYFMLGDKNITFSTHQIGLYGTINTTKNTLTECQQISQKLSNYFRSFSIPKLDNQYILQCKLLLAGFQGLNTSRFLRMIDIVQQQCENFYQTMSNEGFQVYASLTFSKLNFIQKIVTFSKEIKSLRQDNATIEDYMILEQGLAKGIQEITRNLGTLKSEIISRLTTQFCFLINVQEKIPEPSKTSSQQPAKTVVPPQQLANEQDELTKRDIKKLFMDKKLFSSKHLINHYFDIIKTLKHKHSVIVLGHCSTGKSLLIDMLTDNKILKENQFGDEILMKKKEDRHVYIDGFNISLKYVHPNAYSLKELYGDNQKNGIANCLIKDGYDALQKEINNFKQAHFTSERNISSSQSSTKLNGQKPPFNNMGIVFDSEIGTWIEPLLPLIKSSSNYIQPNGKNIIVEHPLKLIFECRDVSSVSPSIILSTNIVHFEDSQLKWQHVFSNYIGKNFKPSFQKKVFVEYCELLVSFIMEPILQFFKSSISNSVAIKLSVSHSGQPLSLSSKTQQHRQDQFIQSIYKSFLKNQVNYIPLIFNQFISLVESHYAKKDDDDVEIFTNKQLDDRDRSVILNLFIMAITWTIGLFISEESKKTFSRHFKYVIKRAVQLNIKGIEKDSLPKDEEDIYQICFINNKWHLWQNVPKIISKNLMLQNHNISPHFSRINMEDSIPLKTKIKYMYMLEKYCDAGFPFYIVGKSSSGKNSLMLQFISTRSPQIYNKILLACTPQTTQHSGKVELKKQIYKEKYSHAFKGFVHRKMTLFYMCDVNLPLMKNQPSLDEFLHEYLKHRGWYLDQTSEFYEFKNIIFCGTLNSSVRFSQNLLKYINPIPYIESEDDIKSKLFSIFEENEFIEPYAQNVVRVMTNLQQVVGRQLKSKFMFGSFNYRDMCEIAQSINFKVNQHMFRNVSLESIGSGKVLDSEQKLTKKRILQCWIIESEKKYRQRFGAYYDQEKIFYFINNVLMEEQRTRYKNILHTDSVFIANLQYYLGRLRISEFKSMKKDYKSTKIFYTQASYKFYDTLETIQQEISSLEKAFQTTTNQTEDEEQSFAKQIHTAVQSKQNTHIVTAYLKSMIAMLDYMMEENSHLMFLIDDRKDDNLIQIATDHDKLQMESTLKQVFTFASNKLKNTVSKSSRKTITKMDKLINYVSKINNSKILDYRRDDNMNDSVLEWKIFITELFELINSPTSANLHDQYVIHLKNLHPSELFILEDLLSLKRTGTLSMLEDYINSEEVELDDGLENSTTGNKDIRKPAPVVEDTYAREQDEDDEDQDEEDEAKRKKMMEEEKLRKRNTAQIIREKILAKIKFMITIDDSQLDEFKQNYSILLQKCHILWVSHLYPSPPTPSQQQPKQPKQPKQNKQHKQLKQPRQPRQSKQSKQPRQPRQSLKQVISQTAEKKQLVSIQTSKKSIHEQAMPTKSQKQSMHMQPCQDNLKVKTEYSNQKYSFIGEDITWDEVRDMYLGVHAQVWSKEELMRVQMEISLRENTQFLRFVKLCRNITQGIEKEVLNQLEDIQQELAYFNCLSTEVIPHLSTLLQQQKSTLNAKQQQLSKASHQINKLQEDKQRFMSYFVKSQQSIALLQRQSRQANELYHQCIGLEEKNFMNVQFALVDLLKSAKDRKVVMTNEMKVFVEVFGLVIGKKLKPDEAMHKEIVKDMAALKVHKKVSNLLIEYPLGQKPGDKTTLISQKAIAKLKQFIAKNLQPEYNKRLQTKQQLQLKQTAIKQLSFSEGLLILLKEYFIYTMAYFSKSQEQNIKALNKKCLKCIKQLAKTKDDYQKSIKSKQYQKITVQLDQLQKFKLQLLKQYDTQNKLYEKLLALEKRALEVVCLNHYGDVDQKQIARKNIIDADLLSSQLHNPIDKLNSNILVERIKNDYIREKEELSAINQSKELIAVLLSSKLFLNTLNATIDPGIITKIINKQSLETLKRIKPETWQNCFTPKQTKDKYGKQDENFSHDQFTKLDRSDILDYLLKEFNSLKVLELINGVVLVENNEQMQGWLGKKTSRALRFQLSLAQKLSNSIIEAQANNLLNKTSSKIHQQQSKILEPNKQSQRTNTNKSQKSYNPSILSNPLIITNLTTLHDAELFLSSILQHKQLQSHLMNHSLIVIYQKIPTQSIQTLFNQAKNFKYTITDYPINVLSLNQNNSDELKFIRYIQHKIQDELFQEKKQSDIKALNRFKELRQSQKQNYTDRKIVIDAQVVSNFLLIKSFNAPATDNTDQTKRDNKIPTNNEPLITTIQDVKLTNRPKVLLQPQPTTNTNNQILKQLSIHLADLKQNLLEYASINQAMESMPNLINFKKKSNLQTTKLVKYLARLYTGLKILQHQNLILQTTSCQRFGEFVLWIVQREKQAQKGQNVQTKLFKQIKSKVWEHYVVSFNHKKLFVGLVFALSGQDSLTETEFDKLIKLIIRLYKYSVTISQIDQKLHGQVCRPQNMSQNQKERQKLAQKHRNQHLINNFILKPLNSKQQKPQISTTFQQALDLISETFSCFTDLKHNMKRKLNVWIQFLKNIDDKFGQNLVNTLPEPYNDINRAFFGIFVTLSQPQKLQKWIDVHLMEQDLTKLTESELLSNQSRLLQMSKLSYKQTILIGDNALSLLSSLSLRTRKQMKLYSKVGSQVHRRSSNDVSHKNSPALTRKDIPFNQLNQMSYFANRKLEKDFVQQMYQCMKNSHWLVIDCDNLISSFTSSNQESQVHKLQLIIKIVDTYTSSTKTDQNEEEDYSETHMNISESSNQNFSMKKINKSEMNLSSLDTCDYQIFFVLSQENKKFITKSSLLNNYRRCLIEITPQNDISRCLDITKLYHQELMVSKKFVKEYQILDFSVKIIAFYALKAMESALSKYVKVKVLNVSHLNSISSKKLINHNQIRQLIDKFSKILIFILQDPQYLLQLLNPNKKIIIKSPVQQDEQKPDSDRQSKTNAQKEGKSRNQVKTNSRFQKQRNQAKKKTLKLTIRPSIRQDDQKTDTYSNQKSMSKMNNPSMKQNSRKKEQSKSKYLEVTELLKLFDNYLTSTLTEQESVSAGFTSAWKHYTQDFFVQLMLKNQTQDDLTEQIKRVQSILIGDPNKIYTSNKSILQDLMNFINITDKDKQKHQSRHQLLLRIKNNFHRNQLIDFSLLQYRFGDIKLFVERLLDGFRHIVNEENFTAQIMAIGEIKKRCESQAKQLKKQLLSAENHLPQAENTSTNQFNFSSLTQNLTIEQMRKKLTRKSSQLPNPNNTQTIKHHTAVSRLKEYLWKKKQDYLHKLEKKLSLLRSLKPVFLLQKINYHCMWEMWKKSDKHNCTVMSLVHTLLELSNHNTEELNHKRLSDLIEYMKKQQNFNITSFFTHSLDNPLPIIDLQGFKEQHELLNFIKLLKDVFIQVNGLKDMAIKHHFFIDFIDNNPKKTIQHKVRATNMYKICEFQGFGMFGCKVIDESKVSNNKDKNEVVLSLNGHDDSQEMEWSRNGRKQLKLVMYFEQAEDDVDSDLSMVDEQEEEVAKSTQGNSQRQQEQQSVQKQSNVVQRCKISFFINKLTLIKARQKQIVSDHAIDKVEVDVIKKSKFWSKDNIKSYLFY